MPSIPSGTPSFQLPSAPSMDCCTSVPRHVAQVARSWIRELFKLGVPHLCSQVARPSDFLELACHAFDTKWHAILEVLLGMVSWRATPICSSGTPIVVDESSVPRPFCVLHFALWDFVLACHAQFLACHAHMHAWTSSLDFSIDVPCPAPGVPCPAPGFK
ncbi:uncharacterized protein DS421_19g655490 [Arachis hypogaea]|uniref:Uncharacterized protein n=1 Tax=Arachis hypogaea TaxID=3818 RepID=A0A6B9VAH1_ARAHY|nr:uncharacterized protein DS421_19g655490 [Arachis hypogaea]